MQGDSDREAELNKKRCEVCGQWFDTSDLDQVFHHDDKPHDAMPAND